jgi:hypothetical protein
LPGLPLPHFSAGVCGRSIDARRSSRAPACVTAAVVPQYPFVLH